MHKRQAANGAYHTKRGQGWPHVRRLVVCEITHRVLKRQALHALTENNPIERETRGDRPRLTKGFPPSEEDMSSRRVDFFHTRVTGACSLSLRSFVHCLAEAFPRDA